MSAQVVTADLLFYLLAIPAAALVGGSKGGVPMVGMLAVPLLTLVVPPIQAVGMLLPIYVVSDMFGLWVYRHAFDRRNLAILIPAGIAGVGVGWATASLVSEAAVTLMLGLIGLAFCLDRWLRPATLEKKQADIPRGIFWGMLTGFTSFVSHAGSPPYQWYVLPQRLDKYVYAGTTTILFAVINLTKLVPFWMLGQLNLGSLETALTLAPAAVIATFAGARVVKMIPEGAFFRLVEFGLCAISLKLIWDGAHALAG
ncbi:sulfite exporter TauE/SafE family protein [Prosthecomicrobium hirschii]|uniref:sulfite exporter TauE/SafE family protein n=1 Tax=Prosthecodimorpha hirschii TaxID=665126 RepID=UPI000AA29BC5|nr:sulfite exporter TauE/SafE family protein [Prosthecomicrobium hirschii]